MKKSSLTDKRFRSGINHPNYKNGSYPGYNYKFSKGAKSYFSNKCYFCNSTFDLVAHHLDSNPRNNLLANIQVLCRNCHCKIHRKYVNIKECRKAQKEREKLKQLREKLKQLNERKRFFFNKFGTDKFYLSKDLQKILGVSRQRIEQLRSVERLKFIRIGGTYLHFYNQK